MRILLIEFRDLIHPEAGGAEVILFEIYERLVDRGHEVDYLCCRQPGAARNDTIQKLRILRRGPQPIFNYVVPWTYLTELKKNRYDVIVEGIDKIPFFMPLFAPRTPVVATVPHLFGTTVFEQASRPVGAYVYLMERPIPWVYRRAPFNVLSKLTGDDIAGRGIPRDNTHVIYPGLDHTLYTPAEQPVRNAHPTLLYLGRLKKYKGIDLTIRALKKLRERVPDARFQIAGIGDYEPELRRLAEELGQADAVDFLGFKAGEEKVEILRKADLLVYASPKEGWGMSVIEANACGTPAVASNSPGLRESVRDGETGLLVPHGDIDALAGACASMLTDEALRGRMATAGLEWAGHFTWERATDETEALLEQSVGAARGKG